jgi:hypothetical protein
MIVEEMIMNTIRNDKATMQHRLPSSVVVPCTHIYKNSSNDSDRRRGGERHPHHQGHVIIHGHVARTVKMIFVIVSEIIPNVVRILSSRN